MDAKAKVRITSDDEDRDDYPLANVEDWGSDEDDELAQWGFVIVLHQLHTDGVDSQRVAHLENDKWVSDVEQVSITQLPEGILLKFADGFCKDCDEFLIVERNTP